MLFLVYIGFSLYLYFQWVAPSLDGRVDQHIAADSETYITYADSLRSGDGNPYVLAALSAFPNTLWIPVFLAFIFKGTFTIVLVNYSALFLSLILLKKVYSFSAGVFVMLLLLNATTTISLLSVNKEIVDLLAVSIFFFARRTHKNVLLFFSLVLAFLNRFEVSLVMGIFLLITSTINPFRQKRILMMITLVLGLSVLLPLVASATLAGHFEEASGGATVVSLDVLEIHYLYAIAVIPKIAENFFGELLNVSKWINSYHYSDLANSYILLSNNFATAVVLIVLVIKHKFTVHSDTVYFALLGCIIMAISLVIQPRYFYFAYVLFCLQVASQRELRCLPAITLPTYLEEVSHD